MAEGTWFESMTKNSIIFSIIFLAINIIVHIIKKWLDKGDDKMKNLLSSVIEVLQSFAISFVAGSTLSLR